MSATIQGVSTKSKVELQSEIDQLLNRVTNNQATQGEKTRAAFLARVLLRRNGIEVPA
jgi:hypothetical protein